jgi:two-component system sensor histidine kinase YesM
MPKKLAELINNRSLRTRMVAICLFIAVVSTGLMAFFSYRSASELVEEQAYRQADDTVGQVAIYIDDRLRKVLAQVTALVTGSDNSFRLVAGDEGQLSTNQRVAAFSNLQSVFAGLRVREPFITSVYLYTPYQQYYELIFQPKADFFNSRTFAEANQSGTQNRWLTPRVDEVFSDNQRVIPLIVPLNFAIGQNNTVVPAGGQQSFDFGKTFLIVNLDERSFLQYLQGVKLGQGSQIYITSANGTPAIHPKGYFKDLVTQPDFQNRLLEKDAKVSAKGSFEFQDNGTTLFVNYAVVDITGWKVVSLQPKDQLLAGLADIQRFTIVVGIICLALSLALSSWLAATITRPLASLRKLMRRVKERDFEVRFPAYYQDEVGDLGRAFNGMTSEISNLIDKVKQEQQAKRHAELEALQVQINPHFLYNTLDSIYWKALMKETDSVAEMAVLLSKLFRLGLNGGRELTTLAKEIEHVEGYLELQRLCYGDVFTYRIEYDPELSRLPVIKLILQPLVENSISHGLSARRVEGYSPGHIEIKACLNASGSHLCLSVSDNGGGFEVAEIRERLSTDQIRPTSKDIQTGHGYALPNIHARLRLHYGEGYHLELASQPFQNTTITLWLPVTPTEKNPPSAQNQPINTAENLH